MFLFTRLAFAQPSPNHKDTETEQFASHIVTMGETVVLVAKKYAITPQDVYEYNPTAVDGLSRNMNLRIPLHRKVDLTVPKPEAPKYITLPGKEAVAQTEGTAAEEALTEAATEIFGENNGNQAAPITEAQAAAPAAIPSDTGYITHDVVSGETLTGVARKYNTTIAAITEANKKVLKRGLQIGQVLKIQATATVGEEAGIASVSEAPAVIGTSIAEQARVNHKVQSGETLTGLARKYNTTIDEITEANKSKLKKGLQAGQVITIPTQENQN